MKKLYILKENSSFNTIISEGKKQTNDFFIVYFLPSTFFDIEKDKKIGISVGKKVGNAPLRNKYKRKMRAIIRQNFDSIDDLYCVVILKPNAINKPNYLFEKKLINLFKEIHAKK